MVEKDDRDSVSVAVVFSCDDRYVPGVLAAVRSLRDHSSCRNIDIFVLHERLSRDSREVPIEEGLHLMATPTVPPDLATASQVDSLSRAMYLRFAAPECIPSAERLIYLDADILVVDDIMQLAKYGLGGCPVGAVRDMWGDPTHAASLVEGGDYFNSGVLIFDRKRWIDGRFTESIWNFASKHAALRFPDQDALNVVMSGKVCSVSERWNRVVYREGVRPPRGSYAEKYGECQASEAGILHFIGGIKPFESTSHLSPEAASIYEKYM